jgi:hypothetical protein
MAARILEGLPAAAGYVAIKPVRFRTVLLDNLFVGAIRKPCRWLKTPAVVK